MNLSISSASLVLTSLLVLPLAAVAAAETPKAESSPESSEAESAPEEPRFTWALGLAVSNGPDYVGSDKRGSAIEPAIGLDIGRYTLSSGGGGSLLDFDREPRETGLNARLLDSDKLHLSAGLRLGGGRKSGTDSPLYGLPDVRRTLRARLSATWLFAPEFSLRSAFSQDLLGRKGGNTLQTTLQYEWQITPSTELGFAAGFTMANATHTRSFFGVPTDVALVRTPYAAYSPGGGVKSTDLGVEFKTAMTDRWVLYGGLHL
ncbi:MAG: MipA/OmpV family protein, partial [Giesbergeria sp.]